MMGSVAYGVSTDLSDTDIYGFCIPPKDWVFPHLRGEIVGFGNQKKRFEQWQEQHIHADDNRSYDLSIYSIVQYFQLCMGANPNMIDSLYTPLNCVTHATSIGHMVRENRNMFLSKKIYHTARGYAFSQMAGMDRAAPKAGRRELVERLGFDTKAAYHTIRLMDEAEQALSTGTIDLQRAKEVLKAVRQGLWSKEQVKEYFFRQEKYLEELYQSTDILPYAPDEDAIKGLLLACLEEHYGSLSQVVHVPGKEYAALEKIIELATRALGHNGE